MVYLNSLLQTMDPSMRHRNSRYSCRPMESSSPMYPQSNGAAERTVQTVKSILKKRDEEGEHIYLGLLSYRSTPISNKLKSPAELLNNRKFKTTLPMPKRVGVTDDTSKTKEELYHKQNLQAFHYNKTAGPTLKELQQGQPVNIYDHNTQRWESGKVGKWSYIVKQDRREDSGTLHPTRLVNKERLFLKDGGCNDINCESSDSSASIANMSATKNNDQEHVGFVTRDGETYIETPQEFTPLADFTIKLVGEFHLAEQPQTGPSCEGKWLASVDGFIFGNKVTRLITLKASDFDSKRQLLDATRGSFPGGSLSFAPGIKNDEIQEYWRWLVTQYDPDAVIKVWETTILGMQKEQEGYWILNNEVARCINAFQVQCTEVSFKYGLLPFKAITLIDK
ncbi:Uncharacterized protein K02A2.6 [Exaiptasia diaphana]|nr:Uncharacterized protein K02A2.6 [Exaiptasia diaphana]